jgi:hypothetical protein
MVENKSNVGFVGTKTSSAISIHMDFALDVGIISSDLRAGEILDVDEDELL